jgi:cellulose synthase/poly-beta-1,6-N-acetylglucosamine synthase-like glycosyltransferase
MTFLPEFGSNAVSILFYIFSGVAALHLFYVFYFFARLAFHRLVAPQPTELPPVSIIIAARNESENLYSNLPHLLEQDYPNFEVIVVNNQSIDDSAYLLSALKRQHKNLHVVEVARSQHIKPGKKLPITLGIKAASYECLLFTDADCQPAGKNWLKSMASRFNDKQQMVLGFAPYIEEPGMLNRIIRFDTTWIGMSYMSMALARAPYMGVGRNLGYTKGVFDSVQGFKSHYSLPSGDDDLFVQAAAKKGNYTINVDPESYVFSKPQQTWGMWLRQKSRHFSTSGHYQLIKKGLLGIYPMSLFILMVLLVTLLLNEDFRWISLSVFGFVTATKWWILGMCFARLQQKRFIPFLPFWELMYALLMPILFYTTEKKGNNQW